MHLLNSKRKKIVVIILAVVLIGGIVYGLFALPEGKHSSSLEIESGQTAGNGPVTVGEDPEASGGKYIQFDPK